MRRTNSETARTTSKAGRLSLGLLAVFLLVLVAATAAAEPMDEWDESTCSIGTREPMDEWGESTCPIGPREPMDEWDESTGPIGPREPMDEWDESACPIGILPVGRALCDWIQGRFRS